jgi:DNA mismatch endonuclease (patch repair protein)
LGLNKTDPVRSRNMAAIKSKNTKPEVAVRSGLHAMGYRYYLHRRSLPGSPDLVFPRRRAVIFVNGCFWHRHNCHLFRWPKTRKKFWFEKIEGNACNDKRNFASLRKDGWRILVIWECALKGKTRFPEEQVILKAADWLEGKCQFEVIQGR